MESTALDGMDFDEIVTKGVFENTIWQNKSLKKMGRAVISQFKVIAVKVWSECEEFIYLFIY